MTNEKKQSRLTGADLGPSLALVGVLAMMVLPVPAFLLDLMLVLSISLALTILVVALYVNQPLDFNAGVYRSKGRKGAGLFQRRPEPVYPREQSDGPPIQLA